MAETSPPDRSLSERLRDIKLIEQALTRAVRKALLRHKQAGNPIAVWRDDRVVWIAPEDIPVTMGDWTSSRGESSGAHETRRPHRPSRPGPRCCEEALMTSALFMDRETLTAICRRHHIRRLSLFGSVLDGTRRPDSERCAELRDPFHSGSAPRRFGQG